MKKFQENKVIMRAKCNLCSLAVLLFIINNLNPHPGLKFSVFLAM